MAIRTKKRRLYRHFHNEKAPRVGKACERNHNLLGSAAVNRKIPLQEGEKEESSISVTESEKEEKLDKDTINQIIEKEKQKKDTLVIYGREFYIYVSIQGDKFNEKLYVEKVGKRKVCGN